MVVANTLWMRAPRLVQLFAAAVLAMRVSCSPAPGAGASDGGPTSDASGFNGGTAGGDGAGPTARTTDAGASGGPTGGMDAAVVGIDAGTDAGNTDSDSGAMISDAGHDAADAGPPPPLVASDHCASATAIPLTSSHVDLPADTTAATHDIDAPCTGDSGPDVSYSFTVSKRVLVYADTFGAGFDTVLFLLSSSCQPITTLTTAGDAVCNDADCGTSQSRVFALLNPGSYRLGLGGSGGAAGSATIDFELALAGSGSTATLPKGTSQQSGTTVGVSGNVNNQTASCIAAGPEDAYWWATCPSDSGGQLSASTCGGASWETLLETEIPRAPSHAYTCALDSCGLQSRSTRPYRRAPACTCSWLTDSSAPRPAHTRCRSRGRSRDSEEQSKGLPCDSPISFLRSQRRSPS